MRILSVMSQQFTWSVFGAGVVSLLLVTGAGAQSTEYTLDASRQWSVTKSPNPESDEATIAEVRRLLASDEPGEAQKILTKFIDTHDGAGHELLAEAYLLRGDAKLAQKNEYSSLYDYEAVARRFAGSEQFVTACERELQIATDYANGRRMKLFGLRISDATDIAIELFIRVQERLPGSDLAEKAAIRLANFYYDRRDMEMARDAYDLYVANHPSGPNRMLAEQRRIYAEIARFKGPRYDAAGLLNARVQIRQFERRFPAQAAETGLNQALVNRIDESLAMQLLESAKWYLGMSDEASARLTLKRLIRAYPESVAAQRAREILESRGWSAPVAPEADTEATSAPSESELGADPAELQK